MPKKNYQAVKQSVAKSIGESAFKKISTFVKGKKPSLWGEQQPHDYLEKYLVLALYKDLKGIGYDQVIGEVDFGIHQSYFLPTQHQGSLQGYGFMGRVYMQSRFY